VIHLAVEFLWTWNKNLLLRKEYVGYPESRFRWAIEKKSIPFILLFDVHTYLTLLFDIVSTIAEVLVV
jgi:hypothetical protein